MQGAFSLQLAHLLSSPEKIRRHVVKGSLLAPLAVGQPIPLPTESSIRDENVLKAVLGIIEIFNQSNSGDFVAAFHAAVTAIAQVGTLTRLADFPSHNAISVLIGLVAVAKSLSLRGNASRQPLLDALRLEYAHLRRDARMDSDKRSGMALCLIEIIKICVSDQVPGIVDSLLASGQGILDLEQLPSSVAVTLKFYMSKHLLFLDQFSDARSELITAYKSIKLNYASQQEHVLWYLIPLQLAQGLFPSRQKILTRFPNLKATYGPLLREVRRGNLFEVRNWICRLNLDIHFFVLTRRIELVVFRRIIKRAFEVSGNRRRIDFDTLKPIFDFAARVESSINVVEEIVANLVMDGMMTGYISYEEQALMLTGSNPFPNMADQ